eukprot:516736-Prymnesium_polylepis.1
MKLVRAAITLVKTQSLKRQMTKAMAMDLETGSANTDRELDLIIDRWAERSQQTQVGGGATVPPLYDTR